MPFRLLLLTAASCLWCLSLLALRHHWSGQSWFLFMAWNLFLAGIPLGFSLLLTRVKRSIVAMPLIGGWLLFFPNAPYVLTDLLHLKERSGVPLWFDLMLLLSFALVSLLLGFQSLQLVQHWIEKRTNSLVAWLFVLTSLMLSGFGIYLGRFLRWNSWDIVSNPHGLAADIVESLTSPGANGRTWGVTLGFGGMLVLAYLFWHLSAVTTSQLTQSRSESESPPDNLP